MLKKEYINIAKKRIKNKKSLNIMINQIEKYYDGMNNYVLSNHKYSIGDFVVLNKGTLLHGTYKNFDGLKRIVKEGLISSWFIDGRISKYPSSIGVWNIQKKTLLRDYINYYSGGTVLINDEKKNHTEVIPYDEMHGYINTLLKKFKYRKWTIEQTKEARFMPSLVQDTVQIGIIFNGTNNFVKELLKGDILSSEINDDDVKEFVNSAYYDSFIYERKHKDDFFTNRESAILFGIPSNFIEGVLVGKEYEKNKKILNRIKKLLPNAYICNVNGIIIMK